MKRGSDARRQTGLVEHVFSKTSWMKPSFLWGAKVYWNIPMGSKLVKNFWRAKTILDSVDYPLRTKTRSFIALICSCFSLNEQHYHDTRMNLGRTQKHHPLYFVFKDLSSSKSNCSKVDKVLYIVVIALSKFQHYFQSHHVLVPSSQLVQDIHRNRETS